MTDADTAPTDAPATDGLPPARWGRRVAAPVIVAIVAAAALAPIDRPVAAAVRSIPVGGDVRRTLETLQQFGDVATMAIAIVIIWLVDPRRVRRSLDWILAAIIGAILFNAVKVGTGRVRPWVVDLHGGSSWRGPMGEFTTRAGDVVRPIEFWSPGVHEALAMPSTHTAHAAIAAVFLSHLYPRLGWLVWPWVVVVALARVRFGSHWPSDTVVGGLLGFALASVVVGRYWGVRGLDGVWRRVVDRGASPAFPASRRADLDAWAGQTGASSST